MAKKVNRNRYKRWFFILLIFNVFYFGYDFIKTPAFFYHYKKTFRKKVNRIAAAESMVSFLDKCLRKKECN